MVVDSIKVASPSEFREKQKSDPTLRALWEKVHTVDKSKYLFLEEQGCLLRQERDQGNPTEGIGPKLVVMPKSYRGEVMRMAHEFLFGGHLGINNTLAKVRTQFFWPDMCEDVANFCRSCDVCQKIVSKSRVPKAELGRLPTIEVPILHRTDESKMFKLKVDTSDTGLGAVLMQEHDGEDFPVAYGSRKLLPRECRYATIEKECLAIVWAIRKFEYYRYGRVFEVHTDHKPLTYMQAKKDDQQTNHEMVHEPTRTQIQTGVHQGQRKCGRRRHESFGLS